MVRHAPSVADYRATSPEDGGRKSERSSTHHALGSAEVCMQLKCAARFAVTNETISRVWHNRPEMKFS